MNAQTIDLRHTLAWLLLAAAAVFASMPDHRHSDVRQVEVAEARALIDASALLIPLEVLEANLAKIEAAKANAVVVYCGDGSARGPEAAHLLTRAGFVQTVNLRPGIEGWRRAGLPTSTS